MNVTVFCFLASYVVAFGLEWWRTRHSSAWAWVGMLLACGAGLTAQTIYLLNRNSETSLPPLLSSSHDWLLVLTWIVVLCFVMISIADRNLGLGVFLLPTVLIVTGAAYLVSDAPNSVVAGETQHTNLRQWAMLHATLLVFGVGGVLVSFLLSMMYLVQHRRLKNPGLIKRGLKLPNLEKLARFNWWTVMISVPLLTLGMLTGVGLGWSQQSPETHVSFSDPVVLVNGVVWVVMFCFFLWLVSRERPVAKQVATLTMWACGFLLATLLGLQILTGKNAFSLETWHTQAAPISSPVRSVS